MPYALRIRFEGGTEPPTPPTLNHYTMPGARGLFTRNGQAAGLRATFTPSTGLPAWAPALNTLAVINQNLLSAADPCPSATCPYEGEGQFDRMLTAWNSGFFAPDYSQLGALGVCGGGDADYWGNQVTVFPLETRQWVRVNNPSPSASVANETYVRTGAGSTYGEWPDGTPAMPHTYGNIAYLPPAAGGGDKGSVILPWKTFYMRQSSTGHGHKCDLATGTWSRATSTAGHGDVASFALDTTRNRVVGTLTGSGSAYQTTLRILGPFTGGVAAHTTLGNAHFGLGNYASSEYVPTIDALVQIGTDQFSVQKLRGYDLASATGAYYDLAVTGDPLPSTGGCGIAWADDANALYLMSSGPIDKQYVWKVVPPAANWQTGTWTSTKILMAGVTVSDTPTVNGMWQRLRYAPSIGSLLWIHGVGGPVYCYRVANPTYTVSLQTTTAPVTQANATVVVTPSSKHLCFAYASGRWWKMCGDHARDDRDSDDSNDGRQEIYSFRVLENDWRKDQNYYIYDPSQVQQFQPDDAWCITRGDEIWVWRSVGVLTRPAVPPEGATAPTAEQVYDHICAFNTVTKRWRKVRAYLPTDDDWRSGRAWRGMYDAYTDRFLIPLEYNGLKVFEMRGSDGVEVSPRTATGALYIRTFADLYQWTPDPQTRFAYAMDWKTGEFYKINLDNFGSIVKIATFNDEAFRVVGPSTMTRGVRQCWHPGLRAVIVGGNYWNVYEVDTGVISQFPRADYFVGAQGKLIGTSDIFFDEPSGMVISIGGIDWDGGVAPNRYYKQAFTRG